VKQKRNGSERGNVEFWKTALGERESALRSSPSLYSPSEQDEADGRCRWQLGTDERDCKRYEPGCTFPEQPGNARQNSAAAVLGHLTLPLLLYQAQYLLVAEHFSLSRK